MLVMTENVRRVRSLLEDVLDDTRNGSDDAAERQRLKDASEEAVNRLHEAAVDLARSHGESRTADRREPASTP